MKLTRRIFIKGLGSYTAVSLCGCASGRADARTVRFGMVTDLHYADHDPDPKPCGVVGRRYYRESKRKLDEAVAVFNRLGLDFAIELGDFKDLSSDKAATLAHLDAIEASFAAFKGPRYHVYGNHDFDCLTPQELGARLRNGDGPMASGHYAFFVKGVRFVVLDACYDSTLRHYSCNNPWNDANVPPAELKWLEGELAAAPGPVVVFCHQRLDPSAEPQHLVRNAAQVREVLERSGKVKTVVTGHQHKGGLNVLNGITYYSLRALVCDTGDGANVFAEGEIAADGSLAVVGWRNAVSLRAKGEFPNRGLAARAPAANAAMVALDAADLSRAAGLPRAGVFLNVGCASVDEARAAADWLRRGGRLGQGFLMLGSHEALARAKAACPWARVGLRRGAYGARTADEAWAVVRSLAASGGEILEVGADAPCSAEQLRFLHDHGIRTVCFSADDAKTMRELFARGHDFVFTDRFSELETVYRREVNRT